MLYISGLLIITLRADAEAGTPMHDLGLKTSRDGQPIETEGKISSPTQVHRKMYYFYCGSYYFYWLCRVYLKHAVCQFNINLYLPMSYAVLCFSKRFWGALVVTKIPQFWVYVPVRVTPNWHRLR
jgi:hypothetical protein